jgi:hypothetical protein
MYDSGYQKKKEKNQKTKGKILNPTCGGAQLGGRRQA